MATYLEIQSLDEIGTASALRNKIKVALAAKARAIAISANSTAGQREWAIAALENPQRYEALTLRFIGVQYGLPPTNLTLAQITAAADADVQTAVNSVVDTLLGA
jgi:hypothetical protein